jgi:hypothetical protein
MSAARTTRRLGRPKPDRGPTDRKFANDLNRLIAEGCVLCGRPAKHLAVWHPTEALQRRLLAPPGKQRHVIVPLCRTHGATPDASMARAQEIILARADSENGAPGTN